MNELQLLVIFLIDQNIIFKMNWWNDNLTVGEKKCKKGHPETAETLKQKE